MRTTTYSPDGKVRCPYCNSVQVKRAKNQPKKYPTPSFLAKTAKTPEFQFWVNGYDCKKCGNEFILESNPAPSSQPLPSTLTSPVVTATPKKVKKKGSFLWKLTFWVMLIFFGLVAWGYFDNQHSPKHTKSQRTDGIEKSQNKDNTLSITETHTIKSKD